jgi:hypothetical protein
MNAKLEVKAKELVAGKKTQKPNQYWTSSSPSVGGWYGQTSRTQD